MPQPIYRVATRASALALAQTAEVVAQLRARFPDSIWTVLPVASEGDRRAAERLQSLAGRGVFVAALEDALRRGDADVAIHSLKDMPTTLPAGLTIAAVPERADARDVFISRTGVPLADLPPGARIGTGAPRRRAQLRLLRPDVQVVDLRGNVDTRLRKLRDGECDAVVLAAAGLRRLGLWEPTWHLLPTAAMLPAVGQGALAVECRATDSELCQLLGRLHHPPTGAAVAAERAFLRALGGGCQWPIAAYAEVTAGRLLQLQARVIPPAGAAWDGRHSGPLADAEALGRALAAQVPAPLRPSPTEESR